MPEVLFFNFHRGRNGLLCFLYKDNTGKETNLGLTHQTDIKLEAKEQNCPPSEKLEIDFLYNER